MKLVRIDCDFSICKVSDYSEVDLNAEYCFIAQTDEEHSLVCPTAQVPEHALKREDGWRAFRIEGVLDFSLIGILARIATLLAEQKIGIFVVSTYNTDYIFVKSEQFDRALEALACAGYETDEPSEEAHAVTPLAEGQGAGLYSEAGNAQGTDKVLTKRGGKQT